jgi:hypothetical protein
MKNINLSKKITTKAMTQRKMVLLNYNTIYTIKKKWKMVKIKEVLK